MVYLDCLFPRPRYGVQFLPDGDDHPPSGFQLAKQCIGQDTWRRRHHDAVEVRFRGPTLVAVSDPVMDVVVPKGFQRLPRSPAQDGKPFHRVYGPNETGQDRRLVARSRADLQDPVRFIRIEQPGHQSHDIGLGHGLSQVEGHGTVFVGVRPVRLGNEPVPRHGAHGLDQPGFVDAAPDDLLLDHPILGGNRARTPSYFLEET